MRRPLLALLPALALGCPAAPSAGGPATDRRADGGPEAAAHPECLEDGDCASGAVCSGDVCTLDLGPPPSGPGPACDDVPDWRCDGDEATCGELILFEPLEGDGWINYPLNGETEANQYRSFARRDVVHLVQYATSKVRCLADGWPGNGGQLGLGDMSEQNGDIPGTAVGQPAHPAGTHQDGYDVDIAYFQVGTDDNLLRPVCEHIEGSQDRYRCLGPPMLLDAWRTALFLGVLHDSPQLRVVGVDGRIGPLMREAIAALCQQGFLSGRPCQAPAVAWETENTGLNWFRFHHHHLHVSLLPRASAGFSGAGAVPEQVRACLIPGCGEVPLVDDPRVRLDYVSPARGSTLR
jgi:hypothetical protein